MVHNLPQWSAASPLLIPLNRASAGESTHTTLATAQFMGLDQVAQACLSLMILLPRPPVYQVSLNALTKSHVTSL